jgi:hypothetical protein
MIDIIVLVAVTAVMTVAAVLAVFLITKISTLTVPVISAGPIHARMQSHASTGAGPGCEFDERLLQFLAIADAAAKFSWDAEASQTIAWCGVVEPRAGASSSCTCVVPESDLSTVRAWAS